MAFLLSTLEIKGSDPRILILDQYFQKPFYEKPLTIQTGSFLQYVSTVSLFGEAMDESDGVSLTLDWLAENREKMRSLVGRAKLEIECGLRSDDGSRFMTNSPDDLRILSEVECWFSIQYYKSF